MNIALYFGSFNPLHYGHLSIAEYLCEQKEIDQVQLIVSPKNPLKNSSDLKEPVGRLDAARTTIAAQFKEGKESLKKIVVSDIEFTLPHPLYTIQTLNHLSSKEPQNNYILIIGADNIEIFKKWHRWEEILNEYEIWVYPRPGYKIDKPLQELQALPNIKGLRYLTDTPLYDISSTEIRNTSPLTLS